MRVQVFYKNSLYSLVSFLVAFSLLPNHLAVLITYGES